MWFEFSLGTPTDWVHRSASCISALKMFLDIIRLRSVLCGEFNRLVFIVNAWLRVIVLPIVIAWLFGGVWFKTAHTKPLVCGIWRWFLRRTTARFLGHWQTPKIFSFVISPNKKAQTGWSKPLGVLLVMVGLIFHDFRFSCFRNSLSLNFKFLS